MTADTPSPTAPSAPRDQPSHSSTLSQNARPPLSQNARVSQNARPAEPNVTQNPPTKPAEVSQNANNDRSLTTADTPNVSPQHVLRIPEHGNGALRVGNPGNGGGRPPYSVRREMLRALESSQAAKSEE